MVTVRVDGGRRQELILAGGEAPTVYLRCLGRLSRGGHALGLQIDVRASIPPTAAPVLLGVRAGCVPDGDPAAGIWASAPILHYRQSAGRQDRVATDTPLLMFYREVPAPSRSGQGAVEYHVVFSHEDAGTDLTGLLAKWGHTTDIEWVYRTQPPASGGVWRGEYQGRGHRTVAFRGRRAWGVHPVLQIAGRHGMVTERVRGTRRVALAPALVQPVGEPREGVLHRFPWVYRVSALEVLRQVPLERGAVPYGSAPADPRRYVFLQWKRREEIAPLEAGVRTGGRWYTSAWGRAELAFHGADAESTAVKLPAGTADAAVDAIAVRALAPPGAPIELALVRAFRLNDAYRPARPLAAGGTVRLTAARTWAVAWRRAEGCPLGPAGGQE